MGRATLLLLTILAIGSVPVGAEGPVEPRPFSAEAEDGAWIGNAICYGPHRDGQRPGGPSPSRTDLADDLARMNRHWKMLRIYGASEFAAELLEVIRSRGTGTKVVLGVWIAPDAADQNRTEVEAAIALCREFDDVVVAVSVGNETQVSWTAHPVPMSELIEYVRQVRAGVDVPVTVADDFNFWNKDFSRAVAAEVDFVMMHAHPMWNGVRLEDALAWLQERVAEVEALHPDRRVVVAETGWATAVHDEGEQARLIKGEPGEAQQARYYDAVRGWAASGRRVVFFFEAFDENWKGGDHPDEVEKHWGLFRADRSAKAAVAAEPGAH